MADKNFITLENKNFQLVLSSDGKAQSLVLKSSNKECLSNNKTPFFAITEERPYNNEIKLACPTKKTIFSANRIRMEENRLIVGFEKLHFEAVVTVDIAERYMVFSLVDFLVSPDSFGVGVKPILPPVCEFRLVQLPIIPREHFGEWLNVAWDEEVAINVLAACPYAKVGAQEQGNHKIFFGESLKEIKLKNAEVALIVAKPQELLDGIEALEVDKGLPLGVASRRSKVLNRSYLWTSSITPENADEYIDFALKGGFKQILMYYSNIVKEIGGFQQVGNYKDFHPEYKNGIADLVAVLNKIKAAGITPGLHILHSHIGLKSRYLTPVADHRLNLTQYFTLAKPCSAEDTTIYVEEDPEGVPQYEKMRVLRFMGELIQYESYSKERPYCFTGCKRGYNDTVAKAHDIGTIGGVLDISEFCANSAYINQRTSLQDEVAQDIAAIYNAGFEFVYFDGSEGVNAPFDINVGLAQWRVYDKLTTKPVFCEGAAKSNFSWHMLSGGNAFDVWRPDVFKSMIAEHPFKEAENMINDFTRVNFGWWRLEEGQRPDIFEYGTALAAAWDCPGAFIGYPFQAEKIPRTYDILETFRRWEDARASGFITPQIKAELKRTDIEHTLLIDEDGKYELASWEQVTGALSGDDTVTVFLLERKGKTCALCWNNAGNGHLSLRLGAEKVSYVEQLGGEETPIERKGDELIIPVDKKRYLITTLSKEQLANAFVNAKLI